MPTKDPTNLESFLRWLPLVFIGLFAGVAKYASDIQAGWIGGLICLSSGLDSDLVYVGSGLSGYGGGAVLNAIWRGFFASKLGIKDEQI